MRTYTVAILGCRSRGTHAARAYHAHDRTRVVALCDLVPERRVELGALVDVPLDAQFDDAHAMIRQARPDIVAIPTGTEYHYDLASLVIGAGVTAIDVEKPICVDLLQTDRLLAAALSAGVSIAVHHQTRSGPALQAIAAAYRTGRIGPLRTAIAEGKGYYGGYGLMNIGVHQINALLELTGPATRVTAVALTDGRPVTPEDAVRSPNGMGTITGENITAVIEFEAGHTATVMQHRFALGVPSTGIEFLGLEGRLLWRRGTAWWSPSPHPFPGDPATSWQPLPLSGAQDDEVAFVDDFVTALDNGTEHRSGNSQALQVMQILMGIFESAAYGRPVQLPQSQRDQPLVRWRRESGLGDAPHVPRPYDQWLAAEDLRLGRG